MLREINDHYNTVNHIISTENIFFLLIEMNDDTDIVIMIE